ncbi:hypothetical protein [Roseivirga sp.]|uniref:hypothetical protein n=1 Tax=Roseivirga sp. TaxID=1964215 RepID=UPI003B51B4B4
MTWKKSSIKAILIVLVAISTSLKGQDLDSDIFFCHENLEIRELWPVTNEQFVANIRYQSKNQFTGERLISSNMFLLFDKTHLITDTVYVSGLNKTLNILDESTISISSNYTTNIYNIGDGQFNLVSKNTPNQESTEKDEYLIGSINGLNLGYISKAKDRTQKRNKKNIPQYFYLNQNGERIFINSGEEKVVGDQWESFLSRFPFALGDVSQYKDELYFNIPMAGRCYILNSKSKKVKTVIFPEDGANSWFLTIDKMNGTHFLIAHKADNSFDIYQIDLKTNSRTLLTNVMGYMDLIHDSKVMYRKTLTEGEKEFYCYYYRSVYTKK